MGGVKRARIFRHGTQHLARNPKWPPNSTVGSLHTLITTGWSARSGTVASVQQCGRQQRYPHAAPQDYHIGELQLITPMPANISSRFTDRGRFFTGLPHLASL
jgi:hypothetical protein